MTKAKSIPKEDCCSESDVSKCTYYKLSGSENYGKRRHTSEIDIHKLEMIVKAHPCCRLHSMENIRHSIMYDFYC